jgi:hypothetical protein
VRNSQAELQAAFTVQAAQGYLYALAPFGVLFALHVLELIGMMVSPMLPLQSIYTLCA